MQVLTAQTGCVQTVVGQGLQTGSAQVLQVSPQNAFPTVGARQIAPKRAKVVKAFIFFLLNRLFKVICVVILLIVFHSKKKKIIFY